MYIVDSKADVRYHEKNITVVTCLSPSSRHLSSPAAKPPLSGLHRQASTIGLWSLGLRRQVSAIRPRSSELCYRASAIALWSLGLTFKPPPSDLHHLSISSSPSGLGHLASSVGLPPYGFSRLASIVGPEQEPKRKRDK